MSYAMKNTEQKKTKITNKQKNHTVQSLYSFVQIK